MYAENQIRVSKASEITEAVKFVESSFASSPDHSRTRILALICEELLQRLLILGFKEIRISLKGLLFKYIVISTAGERMDPWAAAFWQPGHSETGSETETEEAGDRDCEDRVGAQISACLLERYADNFSFRYQNGINIYKVFKSDASIDLSSEIYGYYKDADPDKPHKPTDVLWQVARNHSCFLALSISILILRHLAALMLPVFVSNIINTVTESSSFFIRPLIANILLSVVALTVNLACFALDIHMYRRFARAMEAGFRMALVQKLQVLSIDYHTRSQSGVVLSKVASDIQFVEMLIYDRFTEILFLCEDVLFIIIVATVKFPPMLVFYIVIIPAIIFLLRRFSGSLKDSRANMRRQNEQVSSSINEMLSMESLTRAHGLQKTEYRSILKKVRSAQRASVLYDRQTVSVNNFSYGGFQGLRLLSLSFTAWLTAVGYIDVGTLVLFQSIFDLIVNNVQRMSDAVPLITQGYDSLVSINEILYAADIEKNGTMLLKNPVRGEIEFKNVSFGYEKDKEPVLRNVSFRVPAGGSAALIGKSGGGKTTILNLLLGLYNVEGGEILIDGINLCELEKTAYRRNIAVVPQNTVLFSGTLWDNLVYGLDFVSPERVVDVIRRVGLLDLLETLPDGLNSRIRENGGNLSGGQRQRISIARALLRDPKIVLLDEATSALDSASEKQVQEAVDAMMGSCTVIMVAHRLGTLRCADSIYRIDNGILSRYENYELAIRDVEAEAT